MFSYCTLHDKILIFQYFTSHNKAKRNRRIEFLMEAEYITKQISILANSYLIKAI